LGSGTGYPSFSFPTKSCIEFFFFLRSVISISFSSHISTWCCATMFLIGYLVFLIACFLSLDLIFL
jgi:hypothetical protein